MAKNLKTRKGRDNIYYPYTSPDLVIDSTGENQTVINNNIKTDIQTIKDNQINLLEDDVSTEGVSDNTHDTLETNDKTIIGSINEVNRAVHSIQKKSLGIKNYEYGNLVWESGFLNKDGSVTPNDAFHCTKVSLLGFNKVECKKGFDYISNHPLLLLNSNGEVVRTIDDNTDPIIINLKENEVTLHYFYKNDYVNIDKIYINLHRNDSTINNMQNNINNLLSYDFSELNKSLKYTNMNWEFGCIKNGQIDTKIPNFYHTYIDISGFDIISYNSGMHSYISQYLNCFYDENMTFIGNVEILTNTNQQCTTRIPDGAKYFGFFTRGEHINDNAMCIELLINDNKNFEENSIRQLGGIKYYRDDLEWTHKYYIDGSLSGDTSSVTDHYRNCEIKTKDFNKVNYIKGFKYFDKYRCCFLDSNRAFISNIMDDEYKIGDRVTVDIPENAHYFCYFTMQPFYEENNISFTLSYNDSIFSKVNEIDNIKKYKKAFHERNLLKKPYDLSQRKILFLGDSITVGVTDTGSSTEQNWVKLFTDYNNITTYYNYASSGATWSTAKGDGNYINVELNRAINDSLDVDLIIIAAGTNDYGNSLAIGNEDDTTNTTVYGAINEVINLIKEHFTEAEVIFISPIPRLDTSNEVYLLENYRKAIFYKATLNGYDYVNGTDFPFENKRCDYMTKTMNDGLHPSLLGHKLFAKHLSTILN